MKELNMKKQIVTMALTAFAASLLAAETGGKDEVINAAKKLGEKASYSWKTTVVVPESAQFKPGPTDGKTEKDGFTDVKMTFFENPVEFVSKGDKVAFTDQDGAWKSLAEAEGAEGPGQFMALLV